MAAYIGHHGGNGPAGNGLLGGPEQFGHIGRTHQNEGGRIEPKGQQARAIGNTQFLGFAGQLQVDDGEPLLSEQATGLTQRKAQCRPGIATFVGEHFLQQSAGQHRKPAGMVLLDHSPCLGQRRLALDVGNAVPQRGKALLAIGRAHWGRPSFGEQNRNI